MEQQHDDRDEEFVWSYPKFVRANPAAGRTLESVLQYSGFFAPARLADRDLAIESGYAAASLAALAHDRILLHGQLGEDVVCLDGTDQMNALGTTPGPSIQPHPKMRETSATAVFAERMRIALAMIAHVQIVVEKLAGQHGGERRRRQAITYLETLKAISRLLLLACTKEMVLGGGAYLPGKRRPPQRRDQNKPGPWREADLGRHRLGPPSQTSADPPPSVPRPPEVYVGRRSGVRLVVPPRASVVWSGRGRSSRVGGGRLTTPCDGPCSQGRGGLCGACGGGGSGHLRGSDHGGQQVFTTGEPGGAADGSTSCAGERVSYQRQAEASAPSSGNEQTGRSQAWLMAGEVVHILRPLVYSVGCGSLGERSWRPWLTSLGMDAVSYACTARAGGGKVALWLPLHVGADPSGVPVLPYLDEEQAAELRRRKVLWLLYLMRSPAFQLLAEPASRGAAGVFEGVPILGGMVSYALNMLLYVQRHHFYTSAS